MSVTVTPYGDALYGAGNYGGVTVGGFEFFDQPQNRANLDMGTPAAAMFGQPRPVKA